MVDRPRGGSVDLSKSTIEIMHHRRLLKSDHKGLEEALNEQDEKNYGIKVNGKYYMQILDITKGKSLQREHQQYQDQPLQYFFSFDYRKAPTNPKHQYKSLLTPHFDKFALVNMVYTPVGFGKVQVRLENLADRFDIGSEEIKYINMTQMAIDFFLEANVNAQLAASFEIKELSIGGNQLISE